MASTTTLVLLSNNNDVDGEEMKKAMAESPLLTYNQQDQNFIQLVSSLPFCDSWQLGIPLRLYNGFWLCDDLILALTLMPKQFSPRTTDILLASSPKCGITWLKSLAFSALHRGTHPVSESHPLLNRNPHDLVNYLEINLASSEYEKLESVPNPRLLATHLPLSLLPVGIADTCRIVYVYRDPKDTFVSLWHFAKHLGSSIAMNEAFELFCDGKYICGPIWDHALEYWRESKKSPEKVMFLRYEEMAEDCDGSLRRLAEFMGCGFSLEEESEGAVEKLVNLLSFENLSNLEVNKTGSLKLLKLSKLFPIKNSFFFRKGKVGDWVNWLTPEMGQRLDAITHEKLTKKGAI